MSVDIERTEIYNVTVGPIEGLIERTQTVIMAGDDGFISIQQADELTLGRPRSTRIGLTPPMIAAIVKWANARAQI